MTVFEMLDTKYRETMKRMNATTWKNIKAKPQHPAQTVYMGLEITANDIRENGGWSGELFQEIEMMHKEKLLSSNKHRQAHGQVTKYWLTPKGWKHINKEHAIC